MREFEDGGPAFPVVHEQYDYGYEQKMPKQVAPGMTLRDYFAARALVGYLHASVSNGWAAQNQYQAEAAAKNAFMVADAMLRAREQS